MRAYKSQAVSATNPSFEGTAIPQPYTLFGGAAGSASEVDLDWTMDSEPDVVTVAGTGTRAARYEDTEDTEDAEDADTEVAS